MRPSAVPAGAPPVVRRTVPPFWRRGSAAGLAILVALVAAALLASLAIGSTAIPLPAVLDAFVHPAASDQTDIVATLRIPRTALGLAVGVALGVAGALLQGHTRNPLADPGLLGVQAGAAFAVVAGIAFFGVTSLFGYAWFALLGAGLASVAVFAIGSTRGGPDPVSLVLAGAAINAVLLAGTQVVILSDQQALDDYRFWAVGSVSGRGLDVLVQVLPFLVLGLILAGISASTLNVLQLGDDVARSLGLRPLRYKAVGIAAVMLLAGAATAACGPISFVGLVVPHIARRIAGVDHRWLIPYSGLLGALLVVVADVIGRVVAIPSELQVGIVMALLGGPIFILIVRRMRAVRS